MVCTRCGTTLRDGAAFCGSCGAPAAAPAPPAKRGGALKVLLIVLGVFLLIGALAIAGVVYAGLRIKHRVEREARARGIDLSAMTDSSRGRVRNIDPCSLLTPAEAAEAVGVPIDRAERSGPVCRFFAAAAAGKARETLDTALARTNQGDAGTAENLAKSLGAIASSPGGGPYFTLTVEDNGRMAINAMRLAIGVVSPLPATEDLKGLADDAVLGPMNSTLMFVKHGTGISLDLRLVPEGKARGIALARRILPRL